jgi:hypothetical protein
MYTEFLLLPDDCQGQQQSNLLQV